MKNIIVPGQAKIFSINICGDCANHPDCKDNPYTCPYSLKSTELKARIASWYKANKKDYGSRRTH